MSGVDTAAAIDTLPVLERSISMAEMHKYGAATWDSHRMHYDLDFIASKGIAAPVVDGQMFGAILAGWVLEHLGGDWRLGDLSYRFATFVYADEPIRVSGTVTSRTDDRVEIAARVVKVAADGSDGADVLRKALVTAVRR
jgi:acyl dehydratase